MATKTQAAKTTKPADPTDTLMAVTDQGVGIIKTAFAEDRQLDFAEAEFFRREWGLSKWNIDRLLRRYESIANTQSAAGSVADREALASAAVDAAAAHDAHAPEIQKEIDELQRRLNALERDKHLSAKRRDEANAAVERLRDRLPEPLQSLYDSRRRHASDAWGRQINSLAVDAHELEVLLGLDPSRQDALNTLHSHSVSRHVVMAAADERRSIRYQVDRAKYDERRVDAEQQLKDIRDEINRLQIKFDEAMAEADSMRDYWVQ